MACGVVGRRGSDLVDCVRCPITKCRAARPAAAPKFGDLGSKRDQSLFALL